MAYRFKCSTCEEWHEGLPEIFFDRPCYARAVPDTEWDSRVYLSDDLCSIDEEHFFIRVRLPLTIIDIGEPWGFGMWTSLSRTNFQRYCDHFDDDMSSWDPMFGYLSNRIENYPETLELALLVKPQARGLRPLATLEPCDHPLYIEQCDGISLDKVLKLTEQIRHS
jgi:hypothetical protein